MEGHLKNLLRELVQVDAVRLFVSCLRYKYIVSGKLIHHSIPSAF